MTQRTFEQFADSSSAGSGVEEQAGDRSAHDFFKQGLNQRTSLILDVPVPPKMEQLREVPKMVSGQHPANNCRADRRQAFVQGFLSGHGSTALR